MELCKTDCVTRPHFLLLHTCVAGSQTLLCHKRNMLPLNFSWSQCHWPDVQLHCQIPPTGPCTNLHHRPMMHVCCNFQPLTFQSSALITIKPLCIHAARIKPWSNGCHLSLHTTPPTLIQISSLGSASFSCPKVVHSHHSCP
jgi:hypothetical protein